MAKLGGEPLIHEGAILPARFAFWAVRRGGRWQPGAQHHLDDYSYCDRSTDIANVRIGKFANIAAFSRIGPTNHPMALASQHHFL